LESKLEGLTSKALQESKAQVKGDWKVEAGLVSFQNAFANVGWTVGPSDFWPSALSVQPTLFFMIGTKPGSDGIMSEKASMGNVDWGVLRLPYACANVKIPLLKAPGQAKLDLKLKGGAALEDGFKLDYKMVKLLTFDIMGKVTYTVSKDKIGSEDDFSVDLRIKYDVESKELELGGSTNSPVVWNIPELSGKAEMTMRAVYSGPAKDFSPKKISLHVSGAGKGKGWAIGSAPAPDLFLTGDFMGNAEDGFDWKVTAGVDNMAIDGALKNANCLFTYSRLDGTEVTGAAEIELDLKGVSDKPKMLVSLKWTKATGLQVEGTGTVPICPASWGIPSAAVEFTFDQQRAPKMIASATVSGKITMDALFPGAPTSIDVVAFVSSQSEMYMTGYTQLTLPESLGKKKVDINVKVDKNSGLTASGVTLGLDYKIVDFSSTLNGYGLPDVQINDVILMASAPWGSGNKKAAGVCKDQSRSCATWKLSYTCDGTHTEEPSMRRRRRWSYRRRRRRDRRRRSDMVSKTAAQCKKTCGTCPKPKPSSNGPKAAIWVSGTIGEMTTVEGLVAFTSKGACLVLQASPVSFDVFLSQIGLSSDPLKQQTVALCSDPSVLDDMQLPEVSEIDTDAAKDNVKTGADVKKALDGYRFRVDKCPGTACTIENAYCPPSASGTNKPYCCINKRWTNKECPSGWAKAYSCSGSGTCLVPFSKCEAGTSGAGSKGKCCLPTDKSQSRFIWKVGKCPSIKEVINAAAAKYGDTMKTFVKDLAAANLPSGFSITVPITIARGSAVANMLKFAKMGGITFTLGLGFDFKTKKGYVSVSFVQQTWSNLGAIEQMVLDLFFKVEIGKKLALPEVGISLDMKIRIDEKSGKYLAFKGTVAASPMTIEGSLELYSPSVLRLVSKRIGLISRKSKPVTVSLGFTPATTQLSFGLQANLILSSDKDVANEFTSTAGDTRWDACWKNTKCVAVDFIFAMSVMLSTMVPTIDRVQFRLTGELTFAVLIQSAMGYDLPSSLQGALGKWLGSINLFAFD
jgi:hypothetical protein